MTRRAKHEQDPPALVVSISMIRGAIAPVANTEEGILASTLELVRAMVERNELAPEEICWLFYTVTSDLNAVFPAAIRSRYDVVAHVPATCAGEIDVAGALPACVRVTMLATRPRPRLRHVYLGEAQALRPDLVVDVQPALKGASGEATTAAGGPRRTILVGPLEVDEEDDGLDEGEVAGGDRQTN